MGRRDGSRKRRSDARTDLGQCGDVAVRPPLCEEVLEEVRGGGGGLGGEVGEGGVVLHQHTHHLPELLWGEPRLSLTDKDNVTDGG